MLPEFVSIILLLIVSYGIGCFSAARVIARHFKQLNVDKVGTGHPDTENIYQNVSKILGVLVGAVDMGKIYLYLALVSLLLNRFEMIMNKNQLLLIFGFMMIIGHCLPATNGFKGGRGLFSYIGFALFFAPYPVLIVVGLAILVITIFKQIRFAQYMIVLLPPFVIYFFPYVFPEENRIMFPYFLGTAVLMGIMNFIVSKKLGEI